MVAAVAQPQNAYVTYVPIKDMHAENTAMLFGLRSVVFCLIFFNLKYRARVDKLI